MVQNNSTNNHFFHENTTEEKSQVISKHYAWANCHSRLCQQYICENDPSEKERLWKEIHVSIEMGKTLSTSLSQTTHFIPSPSARKALIPLSGIQRFSQPPKNLTASQEDPRNSSRRKETEGKDSPSSSQETLLVPSRRYLSSQKK